MQCFSFHLNLIDIHAQYFSIQLYQKNTTSDLNFSFLHHTSFSFLVACDYQNAPPLNIRNASVLLHYDLASRKDAFFRYHFIRDAMEKFVPDQPLRARGFYLYNQQGWAEEPVRGTEDKVVEVANFLQRVRPALPEDLLAIAQNRKAVSFCLGSSCLR